MDIFGRERIRMLEAQLAAAQTLGIARQSLVVGAEDYIASLDDTSRRNHIAQVTAFFTVTLKPQLLSMLGAQKDMLARFGLSERETDIYRSNINTIHLLLEWGERCTNEHLGNIEETRRQQAADQTIISDLRTKYEN